MNTANTSFYKYAKRGLALGSERTALWYYGRSVSYGELFQKIDNVADNLYHHGVRLGTVVTIHLPNCPQAVMAIYAVAKLGGICNLVHSLTPPDMLRRNMEFTESAILITYSSDFNIPDKLVFEVDISDYMGVCTRTIFRLKKQSAPGGNSFALLEGNHHRNAVLPDPEALSSECAVYLHSSGSTGTPKTVCLSHSALNHCVANTADFFEAGDMAQQVSLGVLPLFHGFGLAMDVHRNISFGSQLVLMLRWNAKTAVQCIKKRRVTLMVGVPTMYYALLNEPRFHGKRIQQLAKCYVGGDNVKTELIEAFEKRVGSNRCMFVGFGLTEATTTDCVNTYLHYKQGSSGYPVRNTKIAVITENGDMSPRGEGELVISSKTLMIGYLKDQEATNNTLFEQNGERWVRTGDHVRIDEDGFLFFKSRIKNIIIHNGYNIYPEQVESVIRNVPGVKDVCVVGVLDRVLQTQNVRAVVIPEPGTDRAMLQYEAEKACSYALPRYCHPKQYVFRTEFPMNPMGKIDRKELSKP